MSKDVYKSVKIVVKQTLKPPKVLFLHILKHVQFSEFTKSLLREYLDATALCIICEEICDQANLQRLIRMKRLIHSTWWTISLHEKNSMDKEFVSFKCWGDLLFANRKCFPSSEGNWLCNFPPIAYRAPAQEKLNLGEALPYRTLSGMTGVNK